jgi:peptidoglycan/xylan/chitin deacetylase (PgdA/CDA1 family)
VSRKALAALLGLGCLIGVGACAPRHGEQHTHWVSGAAASPSASPDETGDPGDDVMPSAAASPSKSPSTKPSASLSPSAGYLSRVPKFGAPPPAERVHLPEGANAPWFSRIPTDQPVAFLTIDDGWVKRPEALPLLQKAGIPVTLFLTINAIKSNPGYFKKLTGAGAVIEAHTISHPELKGKAYADQHHEICDGADQLGRLYGRHPVLFRPPFGDKDDTTLKVVHDCGLHAAFSWKETVDKGVVNYQSPATSVQRGDIILMHFRDAFVDDFIAALTAIKNAGLTPALLESYIP